MLIAAPLASAQSHVGSIDDVWTRLRSGNTVYVTDAAARETTGVFVKISDAALTIVVDGTVQDIPIGEVREVARRGDSAWTGFFIGAAIGGTLGALALSGACDYGDCRSGNVLLGGVIGGLEAGGIGALIDHFIPGRTVVYRAAPRATVSLAPLFSDRARGLRVALAF